MVKKLSNSIKNLAFSCLFIYIIFALFLGINEANNIVKSVINAFN